MEDSDRKSNSSSSTSNKNRPPIPKSVDENGKSYRELKHFMSPTISATSKFSPKKKILGERNDSLDNLQKTPDLDSKSVHKAASFDSNSKFRTESGESGEKSRPRFLRYNPNRRREILNRRESEEKEGESDDVAPNSAVDSVGGPLAQLEGGEIEESDDEFEEEDEERGWGFVGALKLGILLVVLVLFTSYIVSMNDTTPSPVVEAVVGLRNGYQIVQNHVYEFVNQNLGSFGVFEDKRILDMGMEESGEMVVEDEGGEGEADDSGEGERTEEETKFEGEISDFRNSEMTETVEIVAATIEKEEEAPIVQEIIKDEILEGERREEIAEFDGEISDFSNSEMTETVEIVAAAIEKEEVAPIVQEIFIFEGERVSIGNSTDSHKIGDEPGNSKIKGFLKHLETESVLKAVIGMSLALSASALIASVVLTLKNRNTRNGRENTLHPVESIANFPIPESLKPLEQHSNAAHERPQWSLSHESRAAPTIELLGEIEVAEMSTSLRSCSIKNSGTIETEISSHFSSINEKTTIFSTPPVSSYPLDVQTPPSELISTVNEKKQMKNKASEKVDQSGAKSVSTTPLRRSSRLRTRVTSP